MSGRSYLFVPGNRPDRFEKARSAGADAVILDLEDAARRVLEAAGAAGMEAVRFEGEMIDRPVIERARGIPARVDR